MGRRSGAKRHSTTGQLTAANYDYQADQSLSYDLNGNRTIEGYVTGTNNQTTATSEFDYEFDAEGNRIRKTDEKWNWPETLEFEPPRTRVLRTGFQKAVCRGHSECGVASPERPTGLVEGNKYDTSVAAQVITCKYGYHMPLYRQQDYFGSIGWNPSRSTLYSPLAATAAYCGSG